MLVNVKKPIRLLNNTKYFDPGRSRLKNTFSSNRSYRSRQMKIEGYETRLYWQFRYCQDHNGQVFYYTLTYNDAAIPKFYGVNCFDYADLRYLLTGGFYQYLRRYYGTKFKYFVGAELGDGKGERGMHNNPHYHILFFLEPDENPETCSYSKISPQDFRHLVRLYWQGFDQDIDGYRDYRTAKFGIAKEGEDCGLVSDFRACCYCAKYVTKDAYLVRSEAKISHYVRFYTNKVYKHSLESFKAFYALNKSLFDTHLLSVFPNSAFQQLQSLGVELQSGEYQGDYYKLIKDLGLYEDYCKFVRDYTDTRVHEVLTEYRNRYCNKCRISQGVGIYALSHIDNKLSPSIQVPSKDGFKNRPLPLYLYRKLYTDVVKTDSCVKTRKGALHAVKHSPVRVLNDLGVDLKLSMLPKQIKKVSEDASNYMRIICNNEPLYNLMLTSDVNTSFALPYSGFKEELRLIQLDYPLTEIYKRYAEFKLVYQDRFFAFQDSGSDSCAFFPAISLETDYKRFITSPLFSVSRSDLRLAVFVESGCAGFVPYSTHPYFLRFYCLFALLDLCSDYFFVQNDNKAQSEAERIDEIRRFHSKRELIEFYKPFKSNI